MIKKLAFCLFALGMSAGTYAAVQNYELAPNLSIEYDLPSQTPVVLTNFSIFTISGTCTIQSVEANTIHVKILNRSGTVNGNVMSKGDETDIVVQNGDLLHLSAQPAAQVELTNKGNSSLKALCKT